MESILETMKKSLESDDDVLISGFSNEVDALDESLDLGPNLVSLYRQPENTNISSVLNSINDQYTAVWTYVNESWRAYDPANPCFSDLSVMKEGIGYWMETSRACTWSLPHE